MGITLSRLSFATTMRVVDRIHDDTANMRASPLPSGPTGLANTNIFMVRIANLPDRRHASRKNPTHFARPEPYLNILAIAAHDLSRSTRTTNQLSALPRLQLDIMDRGTQGHAGQWQSISNANLSAETGLHDIPDLQPDRRQDIPLLSVLVVHQSNTGRTIRIVLKRGNGARDSALVPTKINLSVEALMSTPTESYRCPPLVVSRTGAATERGQRFLWPLLREILGRHCGHPAAPRGSRLEYFNSHATVVLPIHRVNPGAASRYALS
jgi:hypothetical protein